MSGIFVGCLRIGLFYMFTIMQTIHLLDFSANNIISSPQLRVRFHSLVHWYSEQYCESALEDLMYK